MNIIGICQIYNEVESGNLERALKHYSGLCDDLVVLDDASTDNPFFIINRYVKPGNQIKNHVNNWNKNVETENKHLLLMRAKQLGPDWVVNFDADEIFEKDFTREELDKIVAWGEVQNIYSFGFNWTNLWLSDTLVRVDGGLGMQSPPRLYKVLPDAEIKVVTGLHKRLWPEYADNPRILPWHLLHYSSSSPEKLADKIIRYCLLDDRFSNIQEAKQYYLYNLLQGVVVERADPNWFAGEKKELLMNEKTFLEQAHEMVIQMVEGALNENSD